MDDRSAFLRRVAHVATVGAALLACASACGSDDGGYGEADVVAATNPAVTATAPLPSQPTPGSAAGSSTTLGGSSLPADPAAPAGSTTIHPGGPGSVTGSTTTTRLGSGPPPAGTAVSSTTITFLDSSRPTVSRGRQVAPTRTLTTTIAYPASGGPYPLVVFAHGFHLGPSHYRHLIDAIAAAGYVVAAPAFPLADDSVGGSDVDRGDIPNQSGDLSFVITQLSGAAGTSGPLAGRVDSSRVGAVGHSDGADTVLDLAYTPGRVDLRVRAVVAMAPDAMTGAGGSVGAAPLLLTHGTSDGVVPYSDSTTVFGQIRVHRFFVTLIGGDHLAPAQGAAPWGPLVDRLAVDLLDHYVAGRTPNDDALVAHASVANVASLQQAG